MWFFPSKNNLKQQSESENNDISDSCVAFCLPYKEITNVQSLLKQSFSHISLIKCFSFLFYFFKLGSV